MPKDENDDWEESTVCVQCLKDQYPKKLSGGGYCRQCLEENAEGFEDDYDDWGHLPDD